MTQPAQQIGFAIKLPNGRIDIYNICQHERVAIAKAVDFDGAVISECIQKFKEEYEPLGYRCVKVSITEVEDESA